MIDKERNKYEVDRYKTNNTKWSKMNYNKAQYKQVPVPPAATNVEVGYRQEVHIVEKDVWDKIKSKQMTLPALARKS